MLNQVPTSPWKKYQAPSTGPLGCHWQQWLFKAQRVSNYTIITELGFLTPPLSQKVSASTLKQLPCTLCTRPSLSCLLRVLPPLNPVLCELRSQALPRLEESSALPPCLPHPRPGVPMPFSSPPRAQTPSQLGSLPLPNLHTWQERPVSFPLGASLVESQDGSAPSLWWCPSTCLGTTGSHGLNLSLPKSFQVLSSAWSCLAQPGLLEPRAGHHAAWWGSGRAEQLSQLDCSPTRAPPALVTELVADVGGGHPGTGKSLCGGTHESIWGPQGHEKALVRAHKSRCPALGFLCGAPAPGPPRGCPSPHRTGIQAAPWGRGHSLTVPAEPPGP